MSDSLLTLYGAIKFTFVAIVTTVLLPNTW
jgi:hypothetical protein